MKNDEKHIDFYKNLESPFNQSEDELWDKIAKRTIEKSKTKTLSLQWINYVAAAVILLFVGTGFFMKFYTQTIISKSGEHLSHILPDNSRIELNAQSSISYQPYWWKFDRKISLSGEAFFEVETGSNFKVISENGITEVLGTSFNIYTRNSDYKVFCKTGKIRVSSTKTDVKFIIEPNQLALIDNIGKKGKVTKASSKDFVSWKENKFNFVNEPIQNVFEELERQYNVQLIFNLKTNENSTFTAYFEKSDNIEQSLDLICNTFNFTFIKTGKNKYKVLQK